MSKKRLIHSRLEFKHWTDGVPEVDAVRPPQCLGCGVASRCPGKRLTVVGHGVRGRQLRGPTSVGQEPELVEIKQRRFRCRQCQAVMVVAPGHVLRYRLFSSVAIVWALALYGVEQVPAVVVRATINPLKLVGATAAQGWRALSDWIEAVQLRALLPISREFSGTPRQVAQATGWALSALALPSFRGESVAHQAVAGTLHCLMGITP